ncbi:hypothetical protein J4230_05500 [Candidatus Woesearchaeota archaeon]|nr:hypothetical protein [Candidatus Woesearchaeota archaeon]
MKRLALYLGLVFASCSQDTTDIARYALKNDQDLRKIAEEYITDSTPNMFNYRFSDETELIFTDYPSYENYGHEDTLSIFFKRRVDISEFAREGRVADNGLDGKLELCDPEDECIETLKRVRQRIK